MHATFQPPRLISVLTKLSIFLVLLLSSQLSAQQISGTVTSADSGEPLIGVTILVRGSTTGTVTDFDGKYDIKVDSDTSALVFSYTGYTSQAITIGNRRVIDVALAESVETLGEVVVVGYGSQYRAKVTGAISSISSEDITELPVYTADQALQGRASGVMVMNNGSPGADPVIRIRGIGTTGNNNPLVVVDGVIVQGLGDVNPNDIESLTVLKDASTTAIYGAKGSNGVILITTKGGTPGETKIDFDAFTGVQRVTERYDLLDREGYIQHARNWGVAQGRIDDPQFGDLINNDTDWQDEIYQDGVMQSYNLAVSGGSANSDFRVGAGYFNQEGVLLNTGIERYTFRANSNFKLGKLRIGETLSASLTDRNPEETAGGRTALEHAIKFPPYFDVFNDENIGGYQGVSNSLDAQDAENPVRVLQLPQNSNKRINLLGNIYAEYEITQGLTAKVQTGLDYWIFTSDFFRPSFSGEPTAQPTAAIGKGAGTHRQITTFGQLNYKKSFGQNNVEVLLLVENTSSNDTRLGANSVNSITDELTNLTNEDLTGGSFSFDYVRRGQLARVNYDFAGKYLLAGSYRRDASANFGSNNRWAPFYSVAAGWVVSKEEFFPQTDLISSLKIRGSIGTVGNDNIGSYQYNSSIVSGQYQTSFRNIVTGGSELGSGTTSGNNANPDLKWETTTMTNIGADLYLLENQVSFSAEYYRNVSNDLLIFVQSTPSLGNNNGFAPSNIGGVTSDGFEFNLGYNDREGDFTWSANINLSTNNNVVNNIGGTPIFNGGFEGAQLLRTQEGLPINHYFGFITDGIFQSEAEILTSPQQGEEGAQPGDIKFLDLAGPDGSGPDGIIDDNDKTYIGNPIPDVTYGLTLRANYKNFDASLFFLGMAGNEIYNTNIWDLEGGRRFFNAGVQALDYWTPENRETNIPRLTTDPQNLQASTRFIEDGSFARLKNVTIGYTFTGIASNVFRSARIYLSGQNLLTFTNYSGLDPEVGASALVGGSGSQIGIDRGNYPQPKSIQAGVQIQF